MIAPPMTSTPGASHDPGAGSSRRGSPIGTHREATTAAATATAAATTPTATNGNVTATLMDGRSAPNARTVRCSATSTLTSRDTSIDTAAAVTTAETIAMTRNAPACTRTASSMIAFWASLVTTSDASPTTAATSSRRTNASGSTPSCKFTITPKVLSPVDSMSSPQRSQSPG